VQFGSYWGNPAIHGENRERAALPSDLGFTDAGTTQSPDFGGVCSRRCRHQ
jgi:hypothetical protein